MASVDGHLSILVGCLARWKSSFYRTMSGVSIFFSFSRREHIFHKVYGLLHPSHFYSYSIVNAKGLGDHACL